MLVIYSRVNQIIPAKIYKNTYKLINPVEIFLFIIIMQENNFLSLIIKYDSDDHI